MSHYFPPRFTIGGKRAFRFARHLPEHGWSTTVLTSPPPEGERLDPSVSVDALAACEVVPELLTRAEVAALPKAKLGSDGTVAEPTRRWAEPSRSIASRVRAELRVRSPIGASLRFVPAMAARIARLVRSTRAEVVFATGAPWEPVVAAALGARSAGVPLVVDFRDPWSFGPLADRAPRWLRTVDGFVERAVLRQAAALTVTTESTRDAYRARAGATRVVCIRTGFDPELRPARRRAERLTLVHFGNCYGERSLAPFLQAVARVRRAGVDARLSNLGRVAQEDLDLAAELGIADAFEHRTVLPYEEGLAVVAGADFALVPMFGDAPWFLPGKLYDYWAARAPILAASRSAEIKGLLDRTRTGFVVDPDDIDAIVRHVEAAALARGEDRELLSPDEHALEALSARSTTGELARLFAEVSFVS